jgi:hypothetical protein
VLRFLRGLNAVLTRGRHVLVDTLAASEAAEAPTVIGWDDGEYLYLSPEAAYQAVVDFYRGTGEVFPIRQGRLMQDLKQAKLLIADKERTTTTEYIGGRKRRVLKVDRAAAQAGLGAEFPPAWTPPVKRSHQRRDAVLDRKLPIENYRRHLPPAEPAGPGWTRTARARRPSARIPLASRGGGCGPSHGAVTPKDRKKTSIGSSVLGRWNAYTAAGSAGRVITATSGEIPMGSCISAQQRF